MDPRAFLDEFRTEASEHLQALDARLLDLERDPSNPLAVREMFLSAHTLKGGAAMLGLAIVRDLSHALEDMLASLRDQRRTFDSDTADLLFRVVDALRERAGRATPDAPASDPAAAQVIALVRAWSAVLPAPAEPEAPLPPGPAAPRVLLVEHSATVRGLESLLLEDAGFEVEALANGHPSPPHMLRAPRETARASMPVICASDLRKDAASFAVTLKTTFTPPPPLAAMPSRPSADRCKGRIASAPASPISPVCRPIGNSVGLETTPPCAKGVIEPGTPPLANGTMPRNPPKIPDSALEATPPSGFRP